MRSFVYLSVFVFFALGVTLSVFFLEPLNTTGGIDELLLAGIERMAHRADFGVDLFGRAAGLEGIAAAASDLNFFVFRMYIFFHWKTPNNLKPKIIPVLVLIATYFLFSNDKFGLIFIY